MTAPEDNRSERTPADDGDEEISPAVVPSPRAAAVIPAQNQAPVVAATVRAATEVPGVDLVVVVDDGSRDDTTAQARQAGAVVVPHSRPLGTAAALETGAAAVAGYELADARHNPRHLVLLDARVGAFAATLAPLVAPVLHRKADLSVAAFDPAGLNESGIAEAANDEPDSEHGGVALARLAQLGVARATGWSPTSPLSSAQCLSRTAFEVCRPLARGLAVEAGLMIDLLRRGFRVVEVPFAAHDPAAARLSAAGRVERARAWTDVVQALAWRRVAPSPRSLVRRGR